MKKYASFLIFIFIMLLAAEVCKTSDLYVSEPRSSSRKYPGTIDSMDIYIHPHGTYMEMNVQLVFTPEGSIFNSITDTLESVMRFNLPKNAFINNLWLYMNEQGQWVEADLLDKWTAGFIYESTVQRMVDPSLLTKTSAINYTLKVFPLLGNSYRIVRMNIFMPCKWSSDEISAILPLHFLNTSKYLPEKVSLYVFPTEDFVEPAIYDCPDVEFEEEENISGTYLKAEVSKDNYSKAHHLKMKNNTDDHFVAFDYWGDEKFYQFVLKMDELIEKHNPQKVAFLLDFEKDKSNISKQQVFDALKNGILDYLSDIDEFNLFLSNDGIYQASDEWLPATEENVENVFSDIAVDMLDDETHLEDLAITAVDWVEKNAEKAKILLIANTDQHGDLETANKLGQDILIELLDKPISFSIATYIQKNWETNIIYSIGYTGNDYLYGSLARTTKGIFKKLQVNGKTIDGLINSTLGTLIGGLGKIDIHTAFNDGYTYETFVKSDDDYYGENYLAESGKFRGELPMKIEVSGEYRNEHFFDTFTFGEGVSTDIYDCKSIWAAQSIKYMEDHQTNENLLIYELIEESLKYNVLSLYTAFLAIEKESQNDSTQTDVEDIITDDGHLKISLYPNPFSEDLNISIEIMENSLNDDLSILIYDAMGRKVMDYGIVSSFGERLNLTWNGKDRYGNELAGGVYFIHIKFGKETYLLKVVKMNR